MSVIWQWTYAVEIELLENGETRLAQILRRVPTASCDGLPEEVEALVAEALPMVRRLKLPWLEVFFRHWRLQSRVLKGCDVSGDTAREAVALLEFANRDETRDCPQSICVAQDLAASFGVLDGPGYVEERVRAAEESLSRIDASRDCFACISGELVSALSDDRRFDEAVERARDVRRRRKAAHVFGELASSYCDALLALGRNEEALEVSRLRIPRSSGTRDSTRRLIQSLALARLGRRDEALQQVPSTDRLEAADWTDYLRARRALPGGGLQPAGEDLQRLIAEWSDTLERRNAQYPRARLHKIAAEISLNEGDPAAALAHVETARGILPRLRRPERTRAQLDVIAARVARGADDPPAS